ncbi:MAG: hypothetical protein COA36_16955 [Desulfotalea sp.]|nr:MAG: hypothetical protein COA36_16955 [Desulfotalea sp.]
MGVTELSLLINGKKVTEPEQWAELKVSAAFGVNSNQPEIEIERMSLVMDAAQEVINHVAGGNIFEGMDAELRYREGTNEIQIFEGFIDTSDNYEELAPSFGSEEAPNKISVKFRGKNTITNFTDQIEGVTYGFLYETGVIKDSDFTIIKTAIIKKSSFVEVAMAIISIYIVSKQLTDAIKDIPDSVANVVAHTTGGITGGIAATIYAIVIAVLQIAYIIAIMALLIKMVTDLISLLLPPIVNNKGCKYRTLLDKVCTHYGYTFISPIPELDVFHYLPTKPFTDETGIVSGIIPKNVPTQKGIPSNGDFGYLVTEMFEICKRMFYAKVDVIGNEVHLRNVDDPFWLKTATFTPRIDLNFQSKKYNTFDLKQTRLTTFITDTNDEWTVENYTGTAYEIKTLPISTSNIKNVVIKGLDRTEIPLALGSNKIKLSPVESAMFELAKAADKVAKIFNKRSNLANKIEQNRINVLKVSQNDYSVAKCVPLINGSMPVNHRTILSAKALVVKYHGGKSFVTGKKLGQKILYDAVSMPFTLSDFQKTLKNGTFVMPDGRNAKFRTIPEWQFSSDMVIADIEVQQIYTNKLKEITYEP